MTRIITIQPIRYVFAPRVRPAVAVTDLLEASTDVPLNPYARVFVLSWLLGTLAAVCAPHLFH